MKKDVIILHDVDGKIYFDAVKFLKERNEIENLSYYETSVFKRLLKAILKRNNIRQEFFRSIKNFIFRFKIFFIKDKVIIFGSAPYDYRVIFYSILCFRNKVYYHTSWPYWWGNSVPHIKLLNRIVFKPLYSLILNNKNYKYICLSKPVADSFKEGILEDKRNKISIIPHSVNLEKFSVSAPKDISEKINVLYVGRMIPEKGIMEICDLIHRLDENKYEVTFVGGGELENYVLNEMKGKKNFNYLGYISNKDDVAKIFKNSHVLLLPSKKINGWEELFGLVIIEAMASGLLVLASDHIGPKSVIKNNVNGIIIKEENAVDEIYNILMNVDCKEINIIRLNAIKSVNNYSIKNVAQSWKEVLEI
ncbi:glycosyltransferase [Acinetobacter sp. SWAC5]|uniref:glycosyltransferase family 4 protein n=1 Tax=Acinetobacter sp. SWAC5 TaxID=2293835 RepID=UPI000E34E1AC|nr:glycosyltransferase family 4 protein [Acinetobacter sp. SWAC5]RFS29454.1 glycosyltransferase [Acinetobacter sp. SWAC5]